MGNTKKGRRVIDFILQNMIIIVFFALVVLLCIFAKGFATMKNLFTMLRQCSISGLLALACTYVTMSGNMDLSTGGITCLCGMLVGLFMLKTSIALSIVMVLIVGIAIGLLNGALVVVFHVQPFILTLGMANVCRGLSMVVSGGNAVYNIPEKYFYLAEGYVGPIPFPVIIFVVIVIIAHILLAKTKLGRYITATGSNEEAARLSGIKVNRIKLIVYTISGFLCSIAGLILTARTNTAEPSSASGWELTAITSVIIGGTSLKGGRGGVLNTLIGILLMVVIDTGMIQMGINSYYQQFIKGVIIVVAVLLDSKKK
jgi:ribose/xylose/arabinose/galactoside ABC-type transport system permease subunit